MVKGELLGASVKWYLAEIEREIVAKMNVDFTGSIEFRINFNEGALTNINRYVKDNIKQK